MTKQWLTHFSDVNLALFGFFLFFVLFMAALVWVFRKESKIVYAEISQLPLNEENEGGNRG